MKYIFILWLIIVPGITCCSLGQDPEVSIITDATMGQSAEHGLSELTSTLEDRNIPFEKVISIDKAKGKILLVAGLSRGTGLAVQLLKDSGLPLPTVAEALSIRKTEILQKPVWIITGFDNRGLMYALLDMAKRISWSEDAEDPFSEVLPIDEKPDVSTRAVSIYTMNRAYWESRFYDEPYWSRYMDMLADNRFNSLVVIFGYENGGFLAPCYPYFFDVEGFPDIKMEGITPSEQRRNLRALNRMIEKAHERGIEFKVGIWDHIYRGGVQAGGVPEKEWVKEKDFRVLGVNAENLSEYTSAALAKFIQMVPHLDGIQLRMHSESGLKEGREMLNFWTEVFSMIKKTTPDLRVDLRAKDLPESVIQIAVDSGLNFTITTKYWMEQMGLPFHPTHINRENQFDRRHGYADMLYYPPDYKIHWRLWTGGSQRVLLWGSPEYARRFVQSTHLYDGEGFEINEPLATKMEDQPHNEKPFDLLNPEYIYYDYEFERYWHFFQSFGRMGYNPGTSSEIWDREFEQRFGKEAGPVVEEALHKASWILPYIVAACSPYGTFPTTRGWPEKQTYGELPVYAMAEGSDIQQFASFDEEAALLIENGETAKQLPSETSRWFYKTHQQVNELIEKARYLEQGEQNKELTSTLTDLGILSNLALYHSYRIPAAVSYRIFVRTNDYHALDDAINYENQAIEAWSRIVDAAGDVYAPDLKMGVSASVFMGINHHLSGHWRDELGYLKEGLEKLKAQRGTLKETGMNRTAPKYKPAPDVEFDDLFQIQHIPVTSAQINEAVHIGATIHATNGINWVRLRYRPVNQTLDYSTLTMLNNTREDVFEATVPADQIDPKFDFMYFIEVMDQESHGRIYPDKEVETPYIIVRLDRK